MSNSDNSARLIVMDFLKARSGREETLRVELLTVVADGCNMGMRRDMGRD